MGGLPLQTELMKAFDGYITQDERERRAALAEEEARKGGEVSLGHSSEPPQCFKNPHTYSVVA